MRSQSFTLNSDESEPTVSASFRLPVQAAQVPWPDFLVGQPGKPVRVLVVDDNPCMRRVIVEVLSSDLRTCVEGQAASLSEGKRLVLKRPFDVALVDLRLSDGSGFELLELIKDRCSQSEVIVISALEDDEQVLHALELGASGYLCKGSWFQDYVSAVLQVVNGGAAITPGLARRLLLRVNTLQHGMRSPRSTAESESLSTREREVLRLVATGHLTDEIAQRLSISPQTVSSHVKNIYRKLRVRTRAQAVSFAGRRGLL